MKKMRKNLLTLLLMSIIFTGCTHIDNSPATTEANISNRNITSSQTSTESSSLPTTTSQTSTQEAITQTSDESTNTETMTATSSSSDIEDIVTTDSTSSNIENIDTTEETTADIEEDIEENATKQIVISFLGDCTLASQKGEEKKGNMINYLNTMDTSYFFEKCMSIIGNDDFTIANCENVFSDDNTEAIYKDYSPAFWFRSSTKNAAVYADSSIDAVSIANNHTNDYGSGGYSETKSALENVNVLWGDIENPIILEKDGISIGIICCKFWGSYNEKSIIKQIEELSETTTLQIVFFHGGTEKIHTPEEWKVEGCRKFVDAGADLVIGGHPHVLQPYEEYNGTSIIYSIGNFCYGGNRSPENRTVIYQQIFTFDGSNNLIESEENIIPFYVFTGSTNNWQPAPIEDEKEKEKVFDFLYGRSDSLF